MLFKKRKGEDKEHLLKDRLANRIAGFLLSAQSRFAVFMGLKTSSMSTKTKWLSLTVFCVAFGGLSIYAFVEVFEDNRKAIKPSQVSVPKHYDGAGPKIKEHPVSEKDIKRINRFKKYMDSLHLSLGGKRVYDSILKTRPGLMDSIHAIEKIYYSQSK